MLSLAGFALCAAAAAAPAPLAPCSAQEAGPVAYGFLPLRDLTAARGASDGLVAALRLALEARGARFVPAADMERILRERRVRYTDSIGRADAEAIGAATGARYLLVGTLLDYRPGADPHIALALRAIDAREGGRVLSTFVTLRGSDFTGLLGLGTITNVGELEDELLARLLESFDEHGAPALDERRDPGRRPNDALASFVLEGFDAGELRRVAVLPPVNRTQRVEAGTTFAELLSHAWFRAGVDVVEPSELRAAFVRQKIRSLDYIDDDVLSRVGAELDARYFVLGSIDRFDDVRVDDELFPRLEASIRVLDTAERHLVAAASLLRRGDDYHVLLGLGNVRDPAALTDRALGEMVALILR